MNADVAIWAALVALLAAGAAVIQRSIVHALMLLIASLLCLAAAFLALDAEFAAAVQLLVYAGAITAVFVFVVMGIDRSAGGLGRERAQLAQAWPLPALAVAAALIPLLVGLLQAPGKPGTPASTGARDLGILLFGPWAVAVELVSLLLLAGLIGVRHLGRARSRPGAEPDLP